MAPWICLRIAALYLIFNSFLKSSFLLAEPLYMADREIEAFFQTHGMMSYDDPRLQRFLDELTRAHPASPVADFAPEIYGSGLEIVDTAERASEIWTRAIHEAQHHIHIQTYFFVDDVSYHQEDPVPCEAAPEVLERNYIGCMLWQAAERGVHVRIMGDSVGNMDLVVGGDRILQQLAKHPQIDVMNYNPVLAYNGVREHLWEPYRVWLWPQNRLHSKVLIVDGKLALTGGRNVGRNYIKPAPAQPSPSWGPRVYGLASDFKYRDTDVFLSGPAVAAIQRGFLKNWLEFGDWEETLTGKSGFWSVLNPGTWVNRGDCLQQTYYGVRYYCKANDSRLKEVHSPDELASDPEFFPALPATGTSWVRFIDSNPFRAGHIPDRPYLRIQNKELDAYRGLTDGERVYLTLIRNAQKSIQLTNSYFALSEDIRRALQEAMQRQVKVEIFSNSHLSNDEAILWDCSVNDFKNFLDQGASIYEWMSPAGMLHAKSAIFDDAIAVVGSFNFDNASFKSNVESLVTIRGKEALAAMKRVWDFDKASPMTRRMTAETLEKDAKSRGIIGYLANPLCRKLGGDHERRDYP